METNLYLDFDNESHYKSTINAANDCNYLGRKSVRKFAHVLEYFKCSLMSNKQLPLGQTTLIYYAQHSDLLCLSISNVIKRNI